MPESTQEPRASYGFGDFVTWQDWTEWFPKLKEEFTPNTFRLAFAFRDMPNWKPEVGTPYEVEAVKAVVALAAENGMKVILDLHNLECGHNYMNMPEWTEHWLQIARDFQGDKRIYAFELYNEPWGQNITQRRCHELFSILTRKIREIDPDRKILWWPANFVWVSPFTDGVKVYNHPAEFLEPNIILQMHHWNIGNANPAETHANALEGLRYVEELRNKYNRPVMIGETGAHNTDPAQIEYVKTFAVEGLARNIGLNFLCATWPKNWPAYQEALRGIKFPALNGVTPQPTSKAIFTGKVSAQSGPQPVKFTVTKPSGATEAFEVSTQEDRTFNAEKEFKERGQYTAQGEFSEDGSYKACKTNMVKFTLNPELKDRTATLEVKVS